MKGMSSTLLALIFAVFSLFSLVMADRSSESLAPLRYGQTSASELGLRIALNRYFERAPLRRSLTQRVSRARPEARTRRRQS